MIEDGDGAWKIEATICGSCRRCEFVEKPQDFIRQEMTTSSITILDVLYILLFFGLQGAEMIPNTSYYALRSGSFTGRGQASNFKLQWQTRIAVQHLHIKIIADIQ